MASSRLLSMARTRITPFFIVLSLDAADAFNFKKKKAEPEAVPIQINDSVSNDIFGVPAEWLTVALPIAALLLALAYFLVEHGKKSGVIMVHIHLSTRKLLECGYDVTRNICLC